MSGSESKIIETIEHQERWLAQFEMPSPSEAAMARVKQAVVSEMRGEAVGHRAHSGWSWKPWHGVFASAASIALAVIVGWSQSSDNNRVTPTRYVAAPVSSDADLMTYTTLDSELSELESVDLDRGTLVDAWDEIWSMTDDGKNRRPG